MFRTLSTTARATTFYLLALGMCVALALTWPNGEAAAVLAMLTPVLAVLIMQLVVTRDGWRRSGWTILGLGRLGTRLWGVAVGLPFGILIVSEAVVRLTGLTTWHLLSATDGLDTLVEVPIMLILVLCEEIGWRGYLGPLLATSSVRAPRLLTGFLHGVWHLPLVFLATDGYLTEGNRWIIVPIFLAVLTCAGQLYGWLRDATGSVYPAVLAHAAFNLGLGIVVSSTATANPDMVAALGREAGIVTLIVAAVAVVWVTTRQPRSQPSPAPIGEHV